MSREPIIALRGLSFRYAGTTQAALQATDLTIDEGDLVVVAGPSGCGKSTLALAIGGYLHHQDRGKVSGQARVAGLDVGAVPLYRVADLVGLVQQNPENQFCTLQVLDEVAFGLENRRLPPDLIQARVSEGLAMALATDLRARALSTLSGGEKQRVAIAAMLAAHPRVLILDEPTSNLDPTATAILFATLDRLRREEGLTVVVIEHKLGQLRDLRPRVVRMAEGRVIDQDAPFPPLVPTEDRAPSGQEGEVLVQAEDLAYHYDPAGADLCALADLSFTLRAGQLVALMGDNGSGKTTLLRCLMGLAQPSAGRLRVLGRDMEQNGMAERVREMGYLFQNPDHQLLAATVWEEATLLGRNVGWLDRVAPRAEADLAAAGLDGRSADHPFTLSYGQKRRLNVVSALAHGPRLLLADEPLIGQDPANAAYLLGRLRAEADAGACVVAALHDPAAARTYADRVLFLQTGRLLADDAPLAALARAAEAGLDAYAPARGEAVSL